MSRLDIDVAAEFPGIAAGPYLDTAARGLLPRSAHAAITASLDSVLLGTADKSAMFATVERARERFAGLINARRRRDRHHQEHVRRLEHHRRGVALAAGDNVVVCRELEHPNNIFPWANLKRRFGIDIRDVRARDGRLSAEDVIAAIDDRTRLVTAVRGELLAGPQGRHQGRSARSRGRATSSSWSTARNRSASSTPTWRKPASMGWRSRRKRGCSASTAWGSSTAARAGRSG